MKPITSLVILVLMLSCANDSAISPVRPNVYSSDNDPIIISAKTLLTGTWNVIMTQSTYPIPSGGQVFAVFGTVDCDKERQWDYLQSLSISPLDSHLLIMQNTYYCTVSRTTYLELFREKGSNKIYVTEKDENGYMIKIYILDPTNNPGDLYLHSDIFDFSYFKFNNVGSMKAAPLDYVIRIKK